MRLGVEIPMAYLWPAIYKLYTNAIDLDLIPIKVSSKKDVMNKCNYLMCADDLI